MRTEIILDENTLKVEKLEKRTENIKSNHTPADPVAT